jgi:hypothetical protein
MLTDLRVEALEKKKKRSICIKFPALLIIITENVALMLKMVSFVITKLGAVFDGNV